MSNAYTMKDLRAVADHFRGHPRFGRTTKLVNIRTGETLIECMGVCTKGDLHIAFMREMTKIENLDASVR